MSLEISGDIDLKISFTSPTELDLNTDTSYNTIYEYTYKREDIEKIEMFDGCYEQNNLKYKIIDFFRTSCKNECTIRVEV